MAPGPPIGSFTPGALFELSKRLHSSVAYEQDFGNGDFSDFAGLYGRPAVFDGLPSETVHGNCPARGRAFRPVTSMILMCDVRTRDHMIPVRSVFGWTMDRPLVSEPCLYSDNSITIS